MSVNLLYFSGIQGVRYGTC